MATAFRSHEWCLQPSGQAAYGDAAIKEAVARGEAVLSFDAHLFAYVDTPLEDGGHLLSLLSVVDESGPDPFGGYRAEQRVPPPLSHWQAEEKAMLVWLMAHSLFDEVAAHLLTADRRIA